MRKAVLARMEKGSKLFSLWTKPCFPSFQFSYATYSKVNIFCILYLTCGEETKLEPHKIQQRFMLKYISNPIGFIQIVSVRSYNQLGPRPPLNYYLPGGEAEPSMKSGKSTEF